jgi:hypothetical protein
MKHKKITVLAMLATLLFSEPSFAGDLYLISGTPTEAVSMPEYPIILFKIDEKKKAVTKVRQIAENGISFIHLYYNERFAYALSRKRRDQEGYIFFSEYKIIDMNAPEIDKSIIVDAENISQVSEPMLLDLPGDGIYVTSVGTEYKKGYKSSGNAAEDVTNSIRHIIGKNIKTGNLKEFTDSDKEHIVLYGVPNSMIAGGGEFFFADQDDENYITIPASGGKRIRTKWKLPRKVKSGKGEYAFICVNNKDMLVTTATKLFEKEKGLGAAQYYILDKDTGEWQTLNLQGGKTYVRTFGGPWLTGAVSGMYRGTPSPGHNKRKNMPRTTGLYYNWRMRQWKKYETGDLFLYNIKTKKKYEINTGNGDSEVLLVDGNAVYYRINDEIYKAPIGKNKVEEGVLLAKDEIVLDIHWAFMRP